VSNLLGGLRLGMIESGVKRALVGTICIDE